MIYFPFLKFNTKKRAKSKLTPPRSVPNAISAPPEDDFSSKKSQTFAYQIKSDLLQQFRERVEIICILDLSENMIDTTARLIEEAAE